MHDLASELRRITLPRTPVNKGGRSMTPGPLTDESLMCSLVDLEGRRSARGALGVGRRNRNLVVALLVALVDYVGVRAAYRLSWPKANVLGGGVDQAALRVPHRHAEEGGSLLRSLVRHRAVDLDRVTDGRLIGVCCVDGGSRSAHRQLWILVSYIGCRLSEWHCDEERNGEHGHQDARPELRDQSLTSLLLPRSLHTTLIRTAALTGSIHDPWTFSSGCQTS